MNKITNQNNKENTILVNNETEVETISLAPRTEVLEEAKTLAKTNEAQQKYCFLLKYDQEKEFLLDVLSLMDCKVEKDLKAKNALVVYLSMDQLKLVKTLECIESVKIYPENEISTKSALTETGENITIVTEASNEVSEEFPSYASSEAMRMLYEPDTTAVTYSTDCASSADMATASCLTISQWHTGAISSPDAQKWYQFIVPKTDTYIVQTTGSLDTVGHLYNSGGSLIESNDDGGGDLNFRIEATLVGGLTYYIQVQAYGSNTGSFDLVVEPNFSDQAQVSTTTPVEIRQTPSASGTVTGTFESSTLVTLLSHTAKNGMWYYVYGLNSDVHWMYGWCRGDHLREQMFILTATKDCYVRGATNVSSSTIMHTADGTPIVLKANEGTVRLLKENTINGSSYTTNDGTSRTDWYVIDFLGTTAYVQADSFEKSTAWNFLRPPLGRTLRANDSNGLEVRTLPLDSAALLGKFADGTELTLIDETPQNGHWYHVYGQMTNRVWSCGWCLDRYLMQEKPIITAIRKCRVRTATTVEESTILRRSNNTEVVMDVGMRAKLLQAGTIDGGTYTSTNGTQSNKWYKIKYNSETQAYVTADSFLESTLWISLMNVYPTELEIDKMVSNIQDCDTSIVETNKQNAVVGLAREMLSAGYEPAFVAGMLANIVREGSTGKFENSNYKSNPSEKKDYLVYMDSDYNGENFYLNTYSNKTIMDAGISVQTVYSMLSDLHNNADEEKLEDEGEWWFEDSNGNATRGGFGLGCLQWTFERTYKLVKDFYLLANGGGDTITVAQATQAENAMVLDELLSPVFCKIIEEWRSTNLENQNSVGAAYSAGQKLCDSYLKPSSSSEKSKRATLAETIYAEMIK